MPIETIEQIAACVVTAGLVAGNFLLFTPWRNGHDPRERGPQRPPKCSLATRASSCNASNPSSRF